MTQPDFAILLTAANRCVADRLVQAVAEVGRDAMRPSFGYVIRAVAAEQPTVSRLAELLGVSKQAASKLADDMVIAGLLQRGGDPADRRRIPLQLTEVGQRVRSAALAESQAMEREIRDRFGDAATDQFRLLLTDFVQRHGAGPEIAGLRSRAPLETT